MMATRTAPEVGPSLFDDLDQTPVSDDTPENRTLDERFWAFHTANPHVFDEFLQIARDLQRRGYNHAGAKMIGEVIRWQRMLRTEDPSGDNFKLNNSYLSRYSRLAMAREPALEGFFAVRELRS